VYNLNAFVVSIINHHHHVFPSRCGYKILIGLTLLLANSLAGHTTYVSVVRFTACTDRHTCEGLSRQVGSHGDMSTCSFLQRSCTRDYILRYHWRIHRYLKGKNTVEKTITFYLIVVRFRLKYLQLYTIVRVVRNRMQCYHFQATELIAL